MNDQVLGVGLAIVAATAWASSAVLARLGLEKIKVMHSVIISLLAGDLLVGVAAFILEWEAIRTLTIIGLAWMALAGLFQFPLGRIFNFTGMRYAGVSRAAPIIGAAPLIAAAFAIIFLGETLTIPLLIATLCIVIGLGLISSR